jgi:hypothetical protein
MTSCRDRGSNSDELDRMDTKATLAAFGRQTTLNAAVYLLTITKFPAEGR